MDRSKATLEALEFARDWREGRIRPTPPPLPIGGEPMETLRRYMKALARGEKPSLSRPAGRVRPFPAGPVDRRSANIEESWGNGRDEMLGWLVAGSVAAASLGITTLAVLYVR